MSEKGKKRERERERERSFFFSGCVQLHVTPATCLLLIRSVHPITLPKKRGKKNKEPNK